MTDKTLNELILAWMVQHRDDCYPSAAVLADELGRNIRHVRAAMNQLQADGKVNCRRSGWGRNSRISYSLPGA